MTRNDDRQFSTPYKRMARRDPGGLTEAMVWPTRLKRLVAALIRRNEGQDLIEYALLTGFLSLIAVVAITAVGEGVDTTYANMADAVNGIGGGGGEGGSGG